MTHCLRKFSFPKQVHGMCWVNTAGSTSVWLVFDGYFKCESVTFVAHLEYVNEYYFVRTKLNWEALEEAPFAAYSSATFFIGTTFMIAVMSKYFKISDTMLALISSSFSTVSKFVFVSSSNIATWAGHTFRAQDNQGNRDSLFKKFFFFVNFIIDNCVDYFHALCSKNSRHVWRH